MALVLTVVFAILGTDAVSAQAPTAKGVTVEAGQQAMRAISGLPIPAEALTVTDTIEMDGDWYATVDFAGRAAHVKFRRTGEQWLPAEMSDGRSWVPLSKGFSILTEMDESGIRSWLRAIASGQLTYAAVCGEGFYAPTLAALATPPPGQPDGFIMKDMVPSPGEAVVRKSHYTVEMTAPPAPRSPRSCNGVPAGGSAQVWSVTARREKGFAGKSYSIDADGNLTEIK